jgi:hypothetical protein
MALLFLPASPMSVIQPAYHYDKGSVDILSGRLDSYQGT